MSKNKIYQKDYYKQQKGRQTHKPGTDPEVKVKKTQQPSSKKNNNYEATKISPYLIPVILILCLVPLFVRLAVYNPGLSQFAWFPDITDHSDLFLYYKQWIFVSIAVLMVSIIAIKAYMDRRVLRFIPVFGPLAVYAFFSLLSAIFSKHREFAFLGGFEQFESVFVLLGYCLMIYYIFLFVRTEKDIEILFTFLLVSVLIMGVLALLQFVGQDFFRSKLGMKLIIPERYRSSLENISFEFAQNRVYATLYNPNYVGSYTALLLPIFIVRLFFQKKLYMMGLYLLAIAGMIVAIIGSGSLTGTLGLAVAAIVLIVLMRHHIIKYYYIAIPVLIIITLFSVYLNRKTDGIIASRMLAIGNIQKTEHLLSSLQTKDTYVSLIYNGNEMRISYSLDGNSNYNFMPTDSKGNLISFKVENNTLVSMDDRFRDIILGADPDYYGVFYIKTGNAQWRFTNRTEDGTYYYITLTGKIDKMISAPSSMFTGYEGFASGRGYLWGKTIPLLKKYIFLGAGPDNYVTAFPQQDYLSKQQSGYLDSIITKPHNLYLQIAVQTGLFSLLAFLTFYGMYFISCIRLYFRGRFHNYYAQVGVAVFLGTIAYMITGLANDSSITTAPIFWTIMGIGILANYKAKPLILAELEECKKLQDARLEGKK